MLEGRATTTALTTPIYINDDPIHSRRAAPTALTCQGRP
jgi:hypothetical protein